MILPSEPPGKLPNKGNAKECSNYHTTVLISHTSEVMLKILQGRLKQFLNHVQAGFRKGRGTRDQIANIRWIIDKEREFQKNIYFCLIDYAKAFDCVDQNKLWKILQEMAIPDHLTFLLRNLYARQDLELDMGPQTGSKFGKEYVKAIYCHPTYLTYMQNTSCEMPDWMKHKLKSRLPGYQYEVIDNLIYTDDTTVMSESKEELKSLLMKVKEEEE